MSKLVTDKILNSNSTTALIDGNTVNAPAIETNQIIQAKTYLKENAPYANESLYTSDEHNWYLIAGTPFRDFVLTSLDNYVYVTIEFALANGGRNQVSNNTSWEFDYVFTIMRGYNLNGDWSGISGPVESVASFNPYDRAIGYDQRPLPIGHSEFVGGLGPSIGETVPPNFPIATNSQVEDKGIWENVWIKDLTTVPRDSTGTYDGVRFQLHTSQSSSLNSAAANFWYEYLTLDYLDTDPKHLSDFQYALAFRIGLRDYLNRDIGFQEGLRITLMEISSNSPDRLTPSQTDISLRNEETS